MKKHILITITLLVTALTAVSYADTCYYMPGNNNTSGDNFYRSRMCTQPMVDQFWDHFDFDKGDWDDGFGYHDACNVNKPLARTFNALWLLAYSSENYARSTGDYSGNALRWGYPYSASNIDELDGRCGNGTISGTVATTYWGWQDNRTVLKWPFFYGQSVVERAGSIVHEARHAAWWNSHNGGAGCPRGSSCDKRWSDMRANSYEVLYLWWFYVDGVRTTTGMRNFARQRGQTIIDTGFNTNPGYVI